LEESRIKKFLIFGRQEIISKEMYFSGDS
jgi:hypothetical protein